MFDATVETQIGGHAKAATSRHDAKVCRAQIAEEARGGRGIEQLTYVEKRD